MLGLVRWSALFVVGGLLSGLFACSQTAQCDCSGPGGVGGAGGMPVASAGGIGGSGIGGSQPTGVGGTGYCGEAHRTLALLPPDILILLDRSGSMNDDITGNTCLGDGGVSSMSTPGACGARSKWALVTTSLNQVVAQTDASVNWGLKFFPDVGNNACAASGAPAVSIGPANGTAIADAIASQTTAEGAVKGSNGTPTNAGEASAAAYLSTLTTVNPKFILLATDGLPTCASAVATQEDSLGAITAVQVASTAGISTFVVGIATAGFTADETLSQMAIAGGYPRVGSPSYYPASTTQELTAILSTLVASRGCPFALGPPPTNDGRTSVNRISIFVDGVRLDRDTTHTSGWDYNDGSHTSITVSGPACTDIKTGAAHAVTVSFKCITDA